MYRHQVILSIAVVLLYCLKDTSSETKTGKTPCENLLLGQYLCDDPEIDTETQQAKECNPDSRTVQVTCRPAADITCIYDGKEHNSKNGFKKNVPCKWTNGHKFETALLLSIFLGMFGIDRFYLGYPAIGLVKFATLGFMFLGQLIDILLIATQVVKPSDGSEYVIDYYGAATTRVMMDNETRLRVQIDGGL
ncbi:TM2 domain-containing protein CG10795-like [Haliotis rubra]|uniref:TM2 domain-containing protein CG10795-like n=1 Tax=Haliotis rubra TaxID=36100 RepID=UPI001EE58816|nr:TM2 domain-containing protein CG10795-like [Haliotis rubra]